MCAWGVCVCMGVRVCMVSVCVCVWGVCVHGCACVYGECVCVYMQGGYAMVSGNVDTK